MIKFVFWDVQHGNATYISTPNGQHIAVDLGTGKLGDGNPAFSPLLHMRDSWGISQLDSVIIIHPHREPRRHLQFRQALPSDLAAS
jgi:competence protein ComEC